MKKIETGNESPNELIVFLIYGTDGDERVSELYRGEKAVEVIESLKNCDILFCTTYVYSGSEEVEVGIKMYEEMKEKYKINKTH